MRLAHQPVGRRQGDDRHPQTDQHSRILLHPRREDDHLAGDGRQRRHQHQLDLNDVFPQVGGEVLEHLHGNQNHQDLIQETHEALTGPIDLEIQQVAAQEDQQLQGRHHQDHREGDREDLGERALKP